MSQLLNVKISDGVDTLEFNLEDMTLLEIFDAGLYNTPIRFNYHGVELSGLIYDDKGFRASEKFLSTHYIFVPSDNLTEFNKASVSKDIEAMKRLSRIIDIEGIRSAVKLPA